MSYTLLGDAILIATSLINWISLQTLGSKSSLGVLPGTNSSTVSPRVFYYVYLSYNKKIKNLNPERVLEREIRRGDCFNTISVGSQ